MVRYGTWSLIRHFNKYCSCCCSCWFLSLAAPDFVVSYCCCSRHCCWVLLYIVDLWYTWADEEVVLEFPGCQLCDRALCHCEEAFQVLKKMVKRQHKVGLDATPSVNTGRLIGLQHCADCCFHAQSARTSACLSKRLQSAVLQVDAIAHQVLVSAVLYQVLGQPVMRCCLVLLPDRLSWTATRTSSRHATLALMCSHHLCCRPPASTASACWWLVQWTAQQQHS